MMLATLAISVSQLGRGARRPRRPRILVAGCAAMTLVYGIGWRLVTRRLLRDDDVTRAEPVPVGH